MFWWCFWRVVCVEMGRSPTTPPPAHPTTTKYNLQQPVDGNATKPGEKGAQLLALLHEVAQASAASPADAALAKSVSRRWYYIISIYVVYVPRA